MNLYKVIFLVDDDIDDREIFIEAITEIDNTIQCICANSGEDVLKILSSDILQRPDLIFLDLNMPRLNGKQVLTEIKRMEGLGNIPVIIYSTFIGNEDKEEMKRLGAVHLMTKATAFKTLLESLKFVLGRKW